MGFPIRKSPDQSLFAAPRGLTQRTTSFIASIRQGIHQMPLSHLRAPPCTENRPKIHPRYKTVLRPAFNHVVLEIQPQTPRRSRFLLCLSRRRGHPSTWATSHKLGRAVALASVPKGTSVMLNSTTTRLTFKTHSQCQRSAPAIKPGNSVFPMFLCLLASVAGGHSCSFGWPQSPARTSVRLGFLA